MGQFKAKIWVSLKTKYGSVCKLYFSNEEALRCYKKTNNFILQGENIMTAGEKNLSLKKTIKSRSIRIGCFIKCNKTDCIKMGRGYIAS